ncbi:hypothetical protein SDC9_192113 [bioreactor metagenome]|uniref:Uncharacterized protein n=1 Tax=bioreactor metagenome TaxID=1076179 RepID=A0A645HZX0_9ZZZZ
MTGLNAFSFKVNSNPANDLSGEDKLAVNSDRSVKEPYVINLRLLNRMSGRWIFLIPGTSTLDKGSLEMENLPESVRFALGVELKSPSTIKSQLSRFRVMNNTSKAILSFSSTINL